MADQNEVLSVFTWRVPVKVDEIIAGLAWRGHAPPRKVLLSELGRLMTRGLVGLDRKERTYFLTRAGRDFKRSGKRIVSGPRGKHKGQKALKPASFRARLWNAFRMQRKASLPDLIELIRKKSDGERLADNARKYMHALVKAKVAVALPAREKGFAPRSNGFIRYALIRDLGPLPPSARPDGLYDFNVGQTLAYTGDAA